jgi:sodium-dependent dicarboxylate transporter 2/3/5
MSTADKGGASGEELPFRPALLLPGLVLALLVGMLARELPFADATARYQGAVTAGVTALSAWCWLSGALPLAPASLLPLGLLPLLGAQRTKESRSAIRIRSCGCSSAASCSRSRSSAPGCIAVSRCGRSPSFGVRPRRLVLGFMMASAGISMWINNTAVALMLLPIGWAVVRRIEESGLLHAQPARRLSTCVMLAIAWGASIGGVATPIGTAPNLIFFSNYRPLVEGGAPPLGFLAWIVAFMPFALLLALAAWGLLVLWFRLPAGDERAGDSILEEIASLPRMSQAEWTVLVLFAATVLAWITRGEVDLGGGAGVPGTGWGRLPERALGLPRANDEFVQDGTIAVLAACVAFVLPLKGIRGPRLMDWPTARKMPLEILFLIGGWPRSRSRSAFAGQRLSAADRGRGQTPALPRARRGPPSPRDRAAAVPA